MPQTPHRLGIVAASAVLTAVLVSGCTTGSADTSTTVTGTNDDCILASDQLDAGKIDFEFTNEADDVSELYVLRPDGDVVSEVENVTTGTSRTLTVDLAAGEYQVRCVPGQTGEGLSQDFTVTGEGGAEQATADREITFDSVDFTYENLDLSDIVTGETIRFEMDNLGDQPHEFEVLDPEDEAVGEIAGIASGFSGGATMTFDTSGVYTYQCILIDPETGKEHTELGMIGTFEVPESSS